MADITEIEIKNQTYTIHDPVARQRNIPSGGSSNQVLTKNSGTNYDASWKTPDFIGDAPSDNKYYIRCNGNWVELGSLDGEGF